MARVNNKQADLDALRRLLIETMWLDYKLFGCRTETVNAMARRIQREKASPASEQPTRRSRQIAFGKAGRAMRFERVEREVA